MGGTCTKRAAVGAAEERRASATIEDAPGTARSWKRDLQIATPLRPPAPGELDGLDQTPGPQQEATYKFYCPLCMYYYVRKYIAFLSSLLSLHSRLATGILKTSCCENYTCFSCASDFLFGMYAVGVQSLPLAHSISLYAGQELISRKGVVPVGSIDSECPHCRTTPFEFKQADVNEKPRNYMDSPVPAGSPGGHSMKTPGAKGTTRPASASVSTSLTTPCVCSWVSDGNDRLAESTRFRWK